MAANAEDPLSEGWLSAAVIGTLEEFCEDEVSDGYANTLETIASCACIKHLMWSGFFGKRNFDALPSNFNKGSHCVCVLESCHFYGTEEE